jgi:signal peptidase I
MTDTGLAELTWKDIAVSAATAIAVAALLRIFVIGVFEIPSHSMENTLLSGDYILVNKLAYRLKSVHRGDVVVFGRATGDASGHEAYVKRVIGIPGDTILLDHDGISVNARPTGSEMANGSHTFVRACPSSTYRWSRLGFCVGG